MRHFFNTSLGRLRVLAFLEGVSLLVLVFVGSPMKYFWDSPGLVKGLGPVHGLFFILFVINAFSVGVQQRWTWWGTTWKLVVASFIPFGTFYIDAKILRPLHLKERAG